MLHVRRDAELAFKRIQVAEILRRFGAIHVEPAHVGVVKGESREAFRVRAKYHIEVVQTDDSEPGSGACTADGSLFRMGLYGADGGVVHIPDCPVTTAALQGAALRVEGALSGLCAEQLPDAVELLDGRDGVSVMLRYEKKTVGELGKASSSLAEALHSDINVEDGVIASLEVNAAGENEIIAGRRTPPKAVAGVEVEGDFDTWSQTAPSVATLQYHWVRGWLPGTASSILDATCGTGGLSLFLAGDVERLVGVDIDYDAVLAAQRAADAAGCTNCEFRGGKIQTVSTSLRRDRRSFDFTVVNPMRRTLGEQAMADLAAITNQRIVYLAPAPRAGAEDFASLVRLGWRLRRVAICDLHPGTARVMMMGVFDTPTS
jgi:tRNA/tmRNA/rRNA uracil-C5-methylase (TrmA/RlmC/RlmD family)